VGLDDCHWQSERAAFHAVQILLVLDKSASMDEVLPGFGFSKWQAIRTALDAAMQPFAAVVWFGLQLYPARSVVGTNLTGEQWCELPPESASVDVALGPGSDTVPAISEVLAATQAGGGTPIAEALRRAHRYFTEKLPPAADSPDRYLLLATDGGPNCNANHEPCAWDACVPNLEGIDPRCQTSADGAGLNCCEDNVLGCVDDAAVLAQIEALRAADVKTIVMGIPGSEAFAANLDQFALAGGQLAPSGAHSYYAVTADAGLLGLEAMFRDITVDLIKDCEIRLEQAPLDLTQVNVAVDCEVVTQSTADDGSGWHYDDLANPLAIILEGEVCTRIQQQGAERIDTVSGCATLY
jgi:hypothetical protein